MQLSSCVIMEISVTEARRNVKRGKADGIIWRDNRLGAPLLFIKQF